MEGCSHPSAVQAPHIVVAHQDVFACFDAVVRIQFAGDFLKQARANVHHGRHGCCVHVDDAAVGRVVSHVACPVELGCPAAASWLPRLLEVKPNSRARPASYGCCSILYTCVGCRAAAAGLLGQRRGCLSLWLGHCCQTGMAWQCFECWAACMRISPGPPDPGANRFLAMESKGSEL